MSATIKVKFTESISCALGSFAIGETHSIPANVAKVWIKTGQAEYADPAEKGRVEKAEADAKAKAEADAKAKAEADAKAKAKTPDEDLV